MAVIFPYLANQSLPASGTGSNETKVLAPQVLLPPAEKVDEIAA